MPPTDQQWPVDGHVHFHQLRLVAPTLDAAARNFCSAGDRVEGLLGAVLLTQAAGERVFEALLDGPMLGGWQFVPVAGEPETLLASRGGAAIAIVCGRQVRAADGLEVLALGTLAEFPDGLDFAEAIERVAHSGAITVLPWGFGKWLGARGKRVAATLAATGPDGIFVGDNGSRMRWLGTPALVGDARRRGFRVLPGTDPFPVAGDHVRVGSFGFLVAAPGLAEKPWQRLRTHLLEQRRSPVRYGRASGVLRFVTNQVGIRLRPGRAVART